MPCSIIFVDSPGGKLETADLSWKDGAALEKAGGNKTKAASFLGVTRRRLYSLLASHGLPGAGDAL